MQGFRLRDITIPVGQVKSSDQVGKRERSLPLVFLLPVWILCALTVWSQSDEK